ncbi:hypothetical protein CKM354_000675900 [Cercospora kikuchii]|uniref:Sec20 C-terminal domain-containing protein n=1 Tax=Cercospora kikuchii TaxID=84275 RepID=A0A9P3CN66_9PEZI|nr:uncharacterized protein CKM354_000675900 [Cercospora kikuchii]GIZ43535.1 hypothetical protein CKM354_000675900 [Cercospora kikuchii]
MDAAQLSTQLHALSDSIKATNSLINKLAKLQFQPGSEPLEGESVVRIELAQDIHDSLKQLEEELEFLHQEAEDYKAQSSQRKRRDSRAGEEARLAAKVARIGEELLHSRQQFRNAQLAAKLASEKAKREEREALLDIYRREADHLDTPPGEAADGTKLSATEGLFARRSKHQQQKQLSKDQLLVNATTDVTAALRRTHQLLSSELDRSRFAQETFEESTAALRNLSEDYSNLDTILSTSRNLLGTLLRSQKSDTWYLETAFYILVGTLVWLVFRRFFYGPFIKLPLWFWNWSLLLAKWIFFKPLFAILGSVGIISRSSASTTSALSSSVAASSSTRPPLIVQPSAQGQAESLSPDFRERIKSGGVRAGAGGAGAKVGKTPEIERKQQQQQILDDDLSESIGKMAEESGKQNQQGQQEEENVVRRGDGTILRDRGEDEPKNPKKKNFEADVEDRKQEEATKEKARTKRDEL